MRVCFVVMPFASIHRPAIGVSLLKAALSKMGVYSNVYYFNLKFAELMGVEFNDLIAENERQPLVGEMIFAKSAFNKEESSLIGKQIERILKLDRPHDTARPSPRIIQELIKVEGYTDSFIDDCSSEILSQKPDLVGFSSTFNQNCSSIALARAIKQKASDIPIVFGGANCEGEMGMVLLKSVPSVDFVCSGEGDISFIEFIESFLIDKNFKKKIQGILTLQSSVFDVALTNPVMDMDSLPIPDFDDYFDSIRKSPIRDDISNHLIMETSRGCWWGEKFQCTFCGLNGSTMKYRSKSTIRAVEEIEFLSKQYKIQTFQVVDNILDLKYFEEFFPMLFEKVPGLNLFYEAKSNLSKKQLQILKRAGVSAIQPGIESFSTPIVKLMKKGVTAIQNIQTLKWCTELGIFPFWNLLWGFAGEPEEEYVKMSTLIEKLVHLYPPTWFGTIILDRFSPYFVNPLKYGIINVKPIPSYRHVYSSLADKELSKIAYHFDFDYLDRRDPRSYTKELRSKLNYWKTLWNTDGNNDNNNNKIPSLTFSRLFGEIIIIKDTRPCSTTEFHTLVDEAALIHETCESLHSFTSIAEKVRSLHPSIDDARIRKLLSEMIDDKIIIQENEAYLSLALPHSPSEKSC